MRDVRPAGCGLRDALNSNLTLNLFNSLVILPMTFLCGTIFSLDNLGPTLETLICLLPLTSVTDCIRATMTGWDFPWASLALIPVWCLAFYLISRHMIVKNRG